MNADQINYITDGQVILLDRDQVVQIEMICERLAGGDKPLSFDDRRSLVQQVLRIIRNADCIEYSLIANVDFTDPSTPALIKPQAPDLTEFLKLHPVSVWDTGRDYANGNHRIAAVELPSHHVMFYDVDRMISGISQMPRASEALSIQDFTMFFYDYGNYNGIYPNDSIKLSFEFLNDLEEHLRKVAFEFSLSRRPK
jgi:hypothetical protein